jgi:catechol 2,3-dioxygenase-like lactoylglutathione lyase family enzyme
MLRFSFGRSVVSCSFFLVLSAAFGCSPSGPPDSARLGVPDRDHGPITDVDIDGDGHTNDSDNCPSLANADQRPACDYPFPPPAPTGTDVVADVIARINFWREILGLDPVVEDAALSASCAAHARYMAETSPSPTMLNFTREEDPASEHYTPEGAEAGMVALMSISSFPVDDITRFLDLVFHRWPLIHPALHRIGVAYDRRFLVVRADALDAAPEGAHAVLWPPPDSAYASAQFPGGETPCMNWVDPTDGEECLPSALMPSVLVPGNAISAVTGSMRRVDTGVEIPLQQVYFDGGESDLEKSTLFQGAILLATPEGSVAPPTEYEVRVDATVDGAPETWRWRFRAGPGINQ